MAQASGAGNWKPVELDREQDDQHWAQPKAGERHPGDRERHRGVIYRGALAGRGNDAERERQGHANRHRRERKDQRVGKSRGDLRHHLPLKRR